MHLRMAGWRQRIEQHTSCVTEELEEEDGIHTIEREACSRESHATVRMRTTLGSEAPRVQVPFVTPPSTRNSRMKKNSTRPGLEPGPRGCKESRTCDRLTAPMHT